MSGLRRLKFVMLAPLSGGQTRDLRKVEELMLPIVYFDSQTATQLLLTFFTLVTAFVQGMWLLRA